MRRDQLAAPEDPRCLLKKGVTVGKAGQLIVCDRWSRWFFLLSNHHQKGHRHRYRVQDCLVHRHLPDVDDDILPVPFKENRSDERSAKVEHGVDGQD